MLDDRRDWRQAYIGRTDHLESEAEKIVVCGIRVTLVQSAYTRTNLDANSPRANSTIAAYDHERSLVSRSIADSVSGASGPDGVANTIV